MSDKPAVTQESLEKQLAENTRMTRAIHYALLGSTEYNQPGLLARYEETAKTVRRHDQILTKWGAVIVAVIFLGEFYIASRK